jgi:hypothetical protein
VPGTPALVKLVDVGPDFIQLPSPIRFGRPLLPALRRYVSKSFGFAWTARCSKTSRAVSMTPTFSATADAMN